MKGAPARLALTMLIASACGGSGGSPPASGPPPQVAPFPATVTDDMGVSVTVASSPARIVSLAPHLTEILFEIGAGDSVAGVSGGETHPPEALVLPAMTDDATFLPDPQAIAAAGADMVLSGSDAPGEWRSALAAAGIPLATLVSSSLDDGISDIAAVGALTGRRAQAAGLQEHLRAEVDELLSAVGGRRGPSAIVETGLDYPPLVVVGPGSFAGDLVARAGGRPAAGTRADRTLELAPAQVQAAAPEVCFALESSVPVPELFAKRPDLAELPCVRDGRIVVLPDDLVTAPTPRLAEGLKLIVEGLYPA